MEEKKTFSILEPRLCCYLNHTTSSSSMVNPPELVPYNLLEEEAAAAASYGGVGFELHQTGIRNLFPLGSQL